MGGRSLGGRRHTLSIEALGGAGAAVAVLAAIGTADLLEGPEATALPWLAIGPMLAAAFAPWGLVVGVGALAIAIAWLTLALGSSPVGAGDIAEVGGLALVTVVAVLVSAIRQLQSQRYADLSKLATVTQEAVLR